jgi:hypothetical protein
MRKRQLPEEFRPLALVVDLANLVSHDEIRAFRSADQRLLQAQTAMYRLKPSRGYRAEPAFRTSREDLTKAAQEIKQILENFLARVQRAAPTEALALLQNKMNWPSAISLDSTMSDHTAFSVLAAIREALVAVVLGLAVDGSYTHLPEVCYSPTASLYKRNGVIRIGVVPISHWLLSMLDGLETSRLRICEVCGKLFVGLRRDQLGCTRKCGDAEYMRRYRQAKYRTGNSSTASARKSASRRLAALKKPC